MHGVDYMVLRVRIPPLRKQGVQPPVVGTLMVGAFVTNALRNYIEPLVAGSNPASCIAELWLNW